MESSSWPEKALDLSKMCPCSEHCGPAGGLGSRVYLEVVLFLRGHGIRVGYIEGMF